MKGASKASKNPSFLPFWKTASHVSFFAVRRSDGWPGWGWRVRVRVKTLTSS